MDKKIFVISLMLCFVSSTPGNASELYQGMDKNGQIFFTDRLDTIPADQRSTVQTHRKEKTTAERTSSEEHRNLAANSADRSVRPDCEQLTQQMFSMCREMLVKIKQQNAAQSKKDMALGIAMASALCSNSSFQDLLSSDERARVAGMQQSVPELRENFGAWTVLEGEAFAKKMLSEMDTACGRKSTAQAENKMSGDRSSLDYYPLAAGDVREFRHTYAKKDDRWPSQTIESIASQSTDTQTGFVRFKNEKGKTVAIKSLDGIRSAGGSLILKLPMRVREEWITGNDQYDQRLIRIENGGLAATIEGRKYTDCVKVFTATQFHALGRGYYSFEAYTTYCPDVGPVRVESYEVSREGGRTWTGMSELISFKRGQAVAQAEQKGSTFIEPTQSFLFPKKGYSNPLLSPNERWIVFHRDTDSGSVFFSPTVHHEERRLPLGEKGKNRQTSRALARGWSPDGSILAVDTDYDGTKSVTLFDFTGTDPIMIGTVRTDGNAVAWAADSDLIYVDELGNIMRKKRNVPPETVVAMSRSFTVQGGAKRMFADRQGTIIFVRKQGLNDAVYVTQLAATKEPLRFPGQENLIAADLSPDGVHAVFRFADGSKIVNHKSQQMVLTLPGVKYSAWSPDGSRLAYVDAASAAFANSSNTAERHNPHFKIIDLRSNKTRDYGVLVHDEHFSWTPDGGHIIYSGKVTHESLLIVANGVFVMQVANGKELARLTNISINETASISSNGRFVLWPAWGLNTFFLVPNPLDPALFRKIAAN